MGKTTYYPKCRAMLSVVFDGFGGGDSAPTFLEAIPLDASVCLNGYKEADTWEITLDAKILPISPDLIRSLAVEIYAFDSGSTDSDVSAFIQPKNLLITGLADNVEMEYSDSGRTWRADGRDYTALLLDREWDPRVRVPNGSLVDVIQTLVNFAVGAASHYGQTLTVVWVSDDPIPVIGNSSVRTQKRGRSVKRGDNYWDVIYSTVVSLGKIVFVRNWQVVITDPQSLTLQSAGLAPVMAYGRNLRRFKADRKLGKERVPQVRVRSYSSKARGPIEAVYPPSPKSVTTGIGTKKDEWHDYALDGVDDPNILLAYAKAKYNDTARNEATVEMSTMSLTDLSDNNVNLLQLRAGHPVMVHFDPFNYESFLEGMALEREQHYQYLKNLGYSDQVATFASQAGELLDQFRRPMYTQEVQFDWSADSGIELSITAGNFVMPKRDDETAKDNPNSKPLAGTVAEPVITIYGGEDVDPPEDEE